MPVGDALERTLGSSARSLCVVLALVVLPGAAMGVNLPQSFVSAAYRYSVRYPDGWYLDATRTTDTLDIDSFPASAAVHAVHLPPGGAKLTLRPWEALHRREAPRTLDSWVKADSAREKVIASRTFDLDFDRTAVPIAEVRAHEVGQPPVFEWIDWYFQIGGRMFQATVLFWQNDSNADDFRDTLRQVVLSLRLEP